MPEESQPRGQSALEYLMTYGWALVVIALVVGILIIASSGGVNKDTCSSFLNFICKDITFEGDTVFLVLQNATGQKITINPFTDIAFDGVTGYAIISYRGQDYRFEGITIGPGETFTISAPGQVFARQLGITYTAENSGLVKDATSTVGTSAPPDTEISNDGIDNDGDNFVDCLDGEIDDCVYALTVTNHFSVTPEIELFAGLQTAFLFDLGNQSDEMIRALNQGNLQYNNTSVGFKFYITSSPPSSITFSSTLGLVEFNNPPKQGWNIAYVNNVIGDLAPKNPDLSITTAELTTISAPGHANEPIAVIQIEEKPSGFGG